MLNLIYGHIGSGKTYLSDTLLFEKLKTGNSVTLLVPEQEVIDSENRIFERAINENVTLEKLSVVSFRRLANLAFRQYGGIEYSDIGVSGRLIILYKIINNLSPSLKVYKNAHDRSLIELMLSVCEELARYCITPSMLEAAAMQASGYLTDKLSDLSLIYAGYCAELSDEYTDSSSDVIRLAEIYKKHAPEKDDIFFIDSFNGFTVPELHVITSLIKHCNVTITLNKPSEYGKIAYKTVEKTEKQLLGIAKDLNITPNIIASLNDDHPYKNKDFKLVAEKLFDFSYSSPSDLFSDCINLVSCSDAFSQAEYIAVNVCKLIRNGARYRDIAVITRNAEKYNGVLDVVFEKYGIPLFLSKREKITQTSIYKAIISAINVISDGYRTDDILSYIKSGICGFSLFDIDTIESYVSLWSINGKRWLEDEDWTMNPRGFTDSLDKNITLLLKKINDIRRKIILPLKALSEDINGASAADACKAIYRFICSGDIIKYFQSCTDNADITAYNTFINMLDTLAALGTDITVTPSSLSSLLYLMAKNTDYGSIPSSFDRVTAGDASIIRYNGIKHVFLTDCENGSFPASASDDSFFSEAEKDFLLLNGIEISPRIDEKNDDEAFYFLRAACSPTQSLTATLCENGGKAFKSIGFQRLCALFPANEVTRYSIDDYITDKIQTPQTLGENIGAIRESEAFDVISALAKEFKTQDFSSNIPISENIINISTDKANEIFGENIIMSYSSFENYVKCPFSYFCRYVLKLNEKKYNFFMASDMGTHIHRILEKAIQQLFKTRDAKSISDSDIARAVDTATSEVLLAIAGSDTSKESTRLEALLSRLKRTLILITTNTVEEFKNSNFRPTFYELPIGKSGSSIPSLEIPLDEDGAIKIRGVVDRVDTYERDGKTYVRIVDYKTGSREHSVSNIKYGLDTQMLIYLFSLWKSGNEEFKKLLNNPNATIVPAGVLYQSAKLPITKSEVPLDKESSIQSAEQKLVRKGVLINDPTILDAMENGLGGRFISAKINSKGTLTASKTTLVDIEGFEELLSQVEAAIKKHGKKMKNGDACASPLKKSDIDSCEYCQLYPICRSKHLQNSEEEIYE